MYLTTLKTFQEEDHVIHWVESSTELIKISLSMAEMLFKKGWTIYFRNNDDEKLYYRSWWDSVSDDLGHKKYHQFPENQQNYYVKKNAILEEKINSEDAESKNN